jgi:hypothetical protein
MLRMLKITAHTVMMFILVATVMSCDKGSSTKHQIDGVEHLNSLPDGVQTIVKDLTPTWGGYDNGGYWRTLPAGPLEIFDMKAEWHSDTNILDIHFRMRLFNVKEGKWEHFNPGTRQFSLARSKNGNWQIEKRSGDEILDMMMIPSNIQAAQMVFGNNGASWVDNAGAIHAAGSAIPRVPTSSDIALARAVQDAVRAPLPKKATHSDLVGHALSRLQAQDNGLLLLKEPQSGKFVQFAKCPHGLVLDLPSEGKTDGELAKIKELLKEYGYSDQYQSHSCFGADQNGPTSFVVVFGSDVSKATEFCIKILHRVYGLGGDIPLEIK